MKRKSVTTVMVVLAFALVIAGCGGGGGGGGTAVTPGTPAVGSVTLLAKTAEPGDLGWGTDTISVPAGNTVLIHIKTTNGTGSAISLSASVLLPAEVSYQSGSGQALYGANQLITIADSIATTGANLGFSLEAGSYAFLDFDVKVASNAASGAKTVTVTVNGVPTTVTINVTAGSVSNNEGGTTTATGTITVTSNKAGSFSLSGAASYSGSVASDGGSYTISNAATGTYTITCNPVSGYNAVVAIPDSATLSAGGSISFACSHSNIVSPPGILRVTSNVTVANVCVSGAASYCGTTDWQTTLTAGSYTLTCPAVTGYTVSSSSVTSGTLSAGNTLTLNCVYAQSGGGSIGPNPNSGLPDSGGGTTNPPATNPPVTTNPPATNPPVQTAQTGTVQVRSNLNVANVTINCAGQAYASYMNPMGNGWGFNATMPAGSCSLSNYTLSGYTVGSSSVTSGTLSAGGTLTLNLVYSSNQSTGGGATGPADDGTGGATGPGEPVLW